MTADARRSRASAARSEAQETLVELLVAYVDRAYVTAGQPGALAAVRDLFRRMDQAALTALAYQLDLEAEPAKEEDEPGERS
jgi:hypothetical protein